MPDLSVVVTCYNLEDYVGEAIASVLSQDFGGEVEIIVVDDCSTDASADRIRAHPQARYVRTERNSGVLLATLAGLQECASEVVFFLDGDDIWEPGKLSAVMPPTNTSPEGAMVNSSTIFPCKVGRSRRARL